MTYIKLEEISKTLDQFPFPKKITFEVCSDCNLACVMCHHPEMQRSKGVMPFELWKKCADEIAQTSPETECWFSFIGEPLLEPELLCKILSYGKSVGLKSLNLNTNGMLMSPEIADLILSTGVDVVVFGVDGFSAAVYESIRIGGIRDELYENIEYFLEARSARKSGTEVQVQFIEMNDNEHELEEFKSYWLKKGAVIKARRKLSWGGRIDTSLNIPREQRIPCLWVINLMHVFWDGRVPLCPGDTEGTNCVGNVWEDSLADLWKRLAPHRQLHLDRCFSQLPALCQTCKDWMTGAAERSRPDDHSQKPSCNIAGMR